MKKIFSVIAFAALAFAAQSQRQSDIKLMAVLESTGLAVSVIDWAREGETSGPKGLDDLIVEHYGY